MDPALFSKKVAIEKNMIPVAEKINSIDRFMNATELIEAFKKEQVAVIGDSSGLISLYLQRDLNMDVEVYAHPHDPLPKDVRNVVRNSWEKMEKVSADLIICDLYPTQLDSGELKDEETAYLKRFGGLLDKMDAHAYMIRIPGCNSKIISWLRRFDRDIYIITCPRAAGSRELIAYLDNSFRGEAIDVENTD